MINQHTQEWYDAKQTCVGASEIYSLVYHYCKDDLISLGVDVAKDKPYRTAQEIFLKIKYNVKKEKIDPVFSEYGLAMEDYLINVLNNDGDFFAEKTTAFYQNGLQAVSPDGFATALNLINVLNNDGDFFAEKTTAFYQNGLQAASPDGFATALKDFYDFDGLNLIKPELGRGVLELKTCNYFDNFKHKEGARMQYIVQLVYQMIQTGTQWGVLFLMTPNKKELDDPFHKGKMVAWKDNFEMLSKQDYNYCSMIYTRLPVIEQLISKAIKLFQDDLENNNTPRESDDVYGLMREKKMWMQINYEKFGIKFLSEDESHLKKLIAARIDLSAQCKKADADLTLVDNLILESIYKDGLDTHSELIADNHRIVFTKNNQMRFYPVK